MKRPNKDEYTKYWVKENDQYVLRGLGRYQEDLDKYCDELEIDKDYVQMHADAFLDSLKKQDKEIERLNKALDKACELLTQCASKCTGDNSNCHYSHCRECSYAINTKERWKEWLMEDD